MKLEFILTNNIDKGKNEILMSDLMSNIAERPHKI